MNDYPIKVGSTLFTLVDPEPGFEVEYNRWYERDHFCAGCMVGPWLFAGGRWVATRALKNLRFPDGDTPVASPVDRGSYRADGVDRDELDPHLGEVSLPSLPGADGETGSGVASMVSWRYQNVGSGDTDNAPMDLGMPAGGPERSLQMFFLDRELTEVWDRFRSYTDQLW